MDDPASGNKVWGWNRRETEWPKKKKTPRKTRFGAPPNLVYSQALLQQNDFKSPGCIALGETGGANLRRWSVFTLQAKSHERICLPLKQSQVKRASGAEKEKQPSCKPRSENMTLIVHTWRFKTEIENAAQFRLEYKCFSGGVSVKWHANCCTLETFKSVTKLKYERIIWVDTLTHTKKTKHLRDEGRNWGTNGIQTEKAT